MIARQMLIPGLIAGAYSAAVVYAQQNHGVGALPMGLVVAVGTAMAILLGFRTAAAHDRWWEARTVWGGIVSDSRTLARQTIAFLSADKRSCAERITHRQIAWCLAVRATLLGEPLPADCASLLGEGELSRARERRSVPNALLAAHEADVCGASLPPTEFIQLDRTLRRLTDHLGACERIRNTPFPFQYDAIVSQAIGLFTVLVPFAVGADIGYATVPVAVALVWVFRAINGVARVLQSPFSGSISGTPMLALSRNIEIDLRQMLNEAPVPPPIPSARGVLP